MPGAARLRPVAFVVALVAAAFLPAAATPLEHRPVPHYEGWVTDLAGMLTPAERMALSDRMESYKRGSGIDIALLTVFDLEGDAIEDFALRVAREWKLGSEKNNGALLVVARDDRRMRIEVGRGLEGTLPDAICGRIIHDVITPRFHRDDFAAGLRLGIEALQKAAGGDYASLPRPRHGSDGGGWGALPVGLFLTLLLLAIARRRRGYGGSILPWLIVSNSIGRSSGGSGGGFGGGGGGFSGFGGGGGFSGGGASGSW